MSEVEAKPFSSILLPTSHVAIFSEDADTLAAARSLPDDWRYARVAVDVRELSAKGASSLLHAGNSPDLVIVQTDVIDEGFLSQLEELAGHCDETTAAIVIGPVNDVNLYRTLIDMGVSDYLVKPVSAGDLSEVVARTLIDRKGVSGSRLVAFMGAKGGVGVSALAQANAWCSADLMGHKTLLLDASGGWSTLSVGMGFEPSTTLTEAVKAVRLEDDDGLDRMLFHASDKLSVLASGGDVMLESPISSEQLEALIDYLMIKYPVVMVDLSHVSVDLAHAMIVRANQIQVVSTPTLVSLRQARTLVHEMRELRGGNEEGIELVVNMEGAYPDMEVSRSDMEAALDMSVATIVPYAPKVFVGMESESRKVLAHRDGDQIVRSNIASVLSKVLLGGNKVDAENLVKKKGLLSGLLGK